MLLQMALDAPFTQNDISRIAEAAPFVDIIEVGTPAVYAMGMQAVRMLRQALPNATLLADLKIADAGAYETQIALDAGADIVTVLASAADSTIRTAVSVAHERGKRILVDLIGVSDPLQRAEQAESMGADILCAHTGLDQQQQDGTPFELCEKLLDRRKTAQIAVAGGINTRNVGMLVTIPVDICVVGSGITKCESLKQGALSILREYSTARDEI